MNEDGSDIRLEHKEIYLCAAEQRLRTCGD
jgi:hypothetical protein